MRNALLLLMLLVVVLYPTTAFSLSNAEYHRFMRESEEFRKADNRLNAAWKYLRKSLRPQDYRRLKAEQKVWLLNRDKLAQKSHQQNSKQSLSQAYAAITARRAFELESKHPTSLPIKTKPVKTHDHAEPATVRLSEKELMADKSGQTLADARVGGNLPAAPSFPFEPPRPASPPLPTVASLPTTPSHPAVPPLPDSTAKKESVVMPPAGPTSDTTTSVQDQKVIRIAAMGDIMMGTQGSLPSDGGNGLFRDVKPYLKDCAVVLGNLEAPLTDRGAPTKVVVKGRSYVFRTPPSYGRHLKDAGFTVVNLANNHTNDYGPKGRAQTREVLDGLGIKHTGAPGQIAWQDVGGKRVAIIGLAPNIGCQNINDIPGAVALVKQAAKHPETIVIVTFHGGAEGSAHTRLVDGPEHFLGENRGNLRKLAHSVIDAGAALVIGHGPHVPRGIEVYKNRLIAYSLGNFATPTGMSVHGATGLAPLLLADINPSGELVNMEIVSFRQQKGVGPRKDLSNGAAKTIIALSQGMLTPEWMTALKNK